MATAIAILIIYHFIFYYRAYFNPMSLARSELLSTFFPSWIYLRRHKEYDDFYWGNYHAHPVLSFYYPFHHLSALITSKYGLNISFIVLQYIISLHVLFCSIGWFIFIHSWGGNFVSLFAAITLTYSAYNIKQQPCINYTIGWFPWILLGIKSKILWLSSLSFGMVLLSGYYPIGIQIALLTFVYSVYLGQSVVWMLLGSIIGLPQLVPFLKHLPKTIRMNAHDDIGKLPWWHPLIELVMPMRNSINGVGYWEMSYYTGIVSLFMIPFSDYRAWILASLAYLLAIGFLSKYFPRIPGRWCFTLQLALGWIAVSGFNNCCIDSRVWLSLILIQAADLYLRNSPLLITHPYSELPKCPSWAFNTPLTRFLKDKTGRISGLPYPIFTGHINELRTLGYSGGMQTKEMSKWRNDKNPNGSGCHDWFKENQDGPELDKHDVRWAFTRKRINWTPTRIKNLYHNPRLP